MRVLFADSNHDILHQLLQNAGFDCALHWHKPVNELLDELPAYEIIVIRSRFKLDAPTLQGATRLRCIARIGAGLENIDTDYASKNGILCLSVPEGNRDALGEHALGMLLMLMNNLKRADAEVRRGIWRRAENRGHEIKGKTVGIIGYGNMGRSFASKLSGLDCTILAYDKYLRNFSTVLVRESSMQDLFNQCDIVSLHVPLTVETKYMANAAFFAGFKKPVYFINTARGPCLETAALVQALENGSVAGACLDVLEYESVSFEETQPLNLPGPMQYLIKSERVVLSPHIGGWTHESNYRMSRLMAEKIITAFGAQKSRE